VVKNGYLYQCLVKLLVEPTLQLYNFIPYGEEKYGLQLPFFFLPPGILGPRILLSGGKI